jgi:protein-disulfide isomerase
LLRRVFGIEILCTKCKAPLRLIALIKSEATAKKILDAMHLPKDLSDPKTRDELVASKQEGLRNKVTATPGLFIDGQPYLYEMNAEAMLDVLEEAYDAKVAARK